MKIPHIPKVSMPIPMHTGAIGPSIETGSIEITTEWLASIGFAVTEEGDWDGQSWRRIVDALSPPNHDGVHIWTSLGSFTLIAKDGTEIELPQYDDGNDVLKMAELLGISFCKHQWGTDGNHSNQYCKKCFISAPKGISNYE